MNRDGFELPADIRRNRAWWLREARDHIRHARACPHDAHVHFGDCKSWHLGQALTARKYARGLVEKWIENRGKQR